MRFDLVDLQLFIAIVEARSITAGADRAHLALASASARIKGLEAALGTALLKRGRRGIELTAAGESLLDHARIILHNVEAMRGDLAAYAGGMKATIRLLTNTSGGSARGCGFGRGSTISIRSARWWPPASASP
jgi:DNA-binding transcriptional LysR family regulator